MYSVAEAHHDFAWAHRKWFADHGLDVNDPAFGRWVPKELHDQWHSGPGGGRFNDYWEAIIETEDPLQPFTVADILDELVKCRQEFAVPSPGL